MNFLKTSRRRPPDNRSRLFIYCLLLSIGLHLLIIILLPLYNNDETMKLQQQPTFVQLVDRPVLEKKPVDEKPREYEIDQLPRQPEPPQPVESPRKAEKSQKVIKEQAPEGKDVRDQFKAPQKQENLTTVPQPATRVPALKQPPQKNIDLAPAQQRKAQPPQKTEPVNAQEKAEQKPAPPVPMLTPEQLLPDASTLDQIASGSSADRNRIKERKNVEIGDTVWLNLQNDLLVSFFRRFQDQVERVWNYPKEAAMAGVEGTLELLITVDKQGELLDVDLRRSSGSDILDFEAIQAVYRAAPFGPLSKYYPHEKLHIRANFRYSIVGKYIYGKQ